MKPLGSAYMPCSVSGQSYPAPGPPQPWTKFPFSSNSSTGGAAIDFWSARTVVGRCNTQAWPRLSIETLDTWPQTHLLGSLAQDASASNFGISRAGDCADVGARHRLCA